MPTIRKLLTARELYDPELTYDYGTDTVYYGETPAPSLDPRVNGSIPLGTGGTLQCDNAATMALLLKMNVDALINGVETGAGATQITAALLALLVILGWVALFVAIIAALVAAAITEGASALNAAFTESTWDELLCILYCNLDENGQFDATSFDAFKTQVDTDIGGLAAAILGYYFQALGFAGLNNASLVVGLQTGDCGDCDCGNCTGYFSGDDGIGDWTIILGNYDSMLDVLDAEPFGGNATWAIWQTPAALPVRISVVIDYEAQSANGNVNFYAIRNDDPDDFVLLWNFPNLTNGEQQLTLDDITMPSGYDQILLNGQALGSSATGVVKEISICF